MKELIKFLLITVFAVLIGNYFFEYVIARDIFPQFLVVVFTGVFIIGVILYITYIVKMLQRILSINPKNDKQ